MSDESQDRFREAKDKVHKAHHATLRRLAGHEQPEAAEQRVRELLAEWQADGDKMWIEEKKTDA